MTHEELCDEALRYLTHGTGVCPPHLVRQLVDALDVAGDEVKRWEASARQWEETHHLVERERVALVAEVTHWKQAVTVLDAQVEALEGRVAAGEHNILVLLEEAKVRAQELEQQQQQLRDAEEAIVAREKYARDLRTAARSIHGRLMASAEELAALGGGGG